MGSAENMATEMALSSIDSGKTRSINIATPSSSTTNDQEPQA